MDRFHILINKHHVYSQRGVVIGAMKILVLYVQCLLGPEAYNYFLVLPTFSTNVCLFFQMHAKTLNIMRRAATLLQIFARHQFGCTDSDTFRRNSLKKTTKFNHYG